MSPVNLTTSSEEEVSTEGGIKYDEWDYKRAATRKAGAPVEHDIHPG
jgi:hypothetical protein